MGRLDGKVIVLTAAAQGIGRAAALVSGVFPGFEGLSPVCQHWGYFTLPRFSSAGAGSRGCRLVKYHCFLSVNGTAVFSELVFGLLLSRVTAGLEEGMGTSPV